MSKLAHIVAVEIDNPTFEGFHRASFQEVMGQAVVWLGPRPHLEDLDPEVHTRPNGKVILQVIPYIVLRKGDRVVAYVRPSQGNEARLHGKVSIGLGGHIDLADVVHTESVVDLGATVSLAAVRELDEEVGIKFDPERINWTGFIVRRDGPVDRVHLGCVGELSLTEEDAAKLGYTVEIGQTRFLRIEDIEREMDGYEIEAWTKAIIEAS